MTGCEGSILQDPSPDAVYTAWTGAGSCQQRQEIGWISPATSAGTLMWTESQPTQAGHSDLLIEISKLSPLKSQSLVRPQLEYTSAVRDPIPKKWSKDVQPGEP